VLTLEAHTTVGELRVSVELAVEPGQCLALAGSSGAGKTSLLRIAAGLLRPERGRVQANGDVWLDTEHGVDVPPELRRCGYVFQDYALFPHLSAWQNVAYPMRGLRHGQRRARALDLLERLGLAERSDARPAALSGGERQRVALARALARGPRALLLDEPLSALDSSTRARAVGELGDVLSSTESPALLVTHDFTEAAQLADRVAIIDSGRIVQEGTSSELAATPRSAFVADFTGAVVLFGIARIEADGLTHVDLEGGGEVVSVDSARGPVAASVYPWEIAIEPMGEPPQGSAQNRLAVQVQSMTTVGNRVRLGLAGPQPLVAEVTRTAAQQLRLRSGSRVTAAWKASATRLIATGTEDRRRQPAG
jgi:molybdenum ABC transporter ATP-binding protein